MSLISSIISFVFVIILIFILILLSFIFNFVIRFFGRPRNNMRVYFRDEFNRITLYRGVNICNYSKYSPDHLPWHTEKEYAKLKTLGFNLVRFLVFWEAIEPERKKYDYYYLEGVKKHIRMLNKFGIKVIIDIHQDLYCNKYNGNGFPEWTLPDKEYKYKQQKKWYMNYLQPAVKEAYKYFWKNEELKHYYSSMICFLDKQLSSEKNIIGIDVMNEPFPILPFFWRFEKKILMLFYKKLKIMLSVHESTIPLFLEPYILTSTGIPSDIPKDVAFITNKYIPHYYPPFSHNEGTYNKINRFLTKTSIGSKVWEAQELGSPAIIGEFGISPKVKNYYNFIKDFLTISNVHHISWAWYCFDLEKHSIQGLLDNDRNLNKLAYSLSQIYPQKIAGKNIVMRNENDTFYLEYDETSMSLCTEVFIPSWQKIKVIGCICEKEGDILKISHKNPGPQKIQIKILEYQK